MVTDFFVSNVINQRQFLDSRGRIQDRAINSIPVSHIPISGMRHNDMNRVRPRRIDRGQSRSCDHDHCGRSGVRLGLPYRATTCDVRLVVACASIGGEAIAMQAAEQMTTAARVAQLTLR